MELTQPIRMPITDVAILCVWLSVFQTLFDNYKI